MRACTCETYSCVHLLHFFYFSHQGTRDRIAEEILSTERKYVTALGVCIDVFLDPLEVQKKLITQDEIRFIFSDIRPIHFFNTKLAEDLAERLENWSSTQCIGDIFLKLIEFMKVYKLYVQNYSRSLTLLDKLQRKNPKYVLWWGWCVVMVVVDTVAVVCCAVVPLCYLSVPFVCWNM
jgi:RhoGEF domain